MNRPFRAKFAQKRDDSKEGGSVKGGLVIVVAIVQDAADARSKHHIFEDRFGKRIRFLNTIPTRRRKLTKLRCR